MTRFSILARERANGHAADLEDFTVREQGSADAAQLLTRSDLSLYCLDIKGKKAVFVSTPPEIDLEAAPFYYGAQFQHAQELFTVDLDAFQKLAAQIPAAEHLIFVHNIGRCGSTLLSRAFSQIDSCTSYSEPDCFTQMAFWRTSDDRRDHLWRSLLPACMNFVFRDARARCPSTAIIKFRSGCVNLIDLFLEEFPRGRHLFLYRNCDTWAASFISLIGRRNPLKPMTRQQAMDDWHFHTGRCIDQVSFPFNRLPEPLNWVQYFTVAWLANLELVTNIMKSHPGHLLPLTYEELATESEPCLRKVFAHCNLPQDRLADSLNAFAHDSQAGTRLARIDADTVVGINRQLP